MNEFYYYFFNIKIYTIYIISTISIYEKGEKHIHWNYMGKIPLPNFPPIGDT